MSLASDLTDTVKLAVSNLSAAWKFEKKAAQMDPLLTKVMDDIEETKRFISSAESGPDQILERVKQITESSSLETLVDNNWSVLPVNGPGLTRKIVDLLSDAENALEQGSSQIIELVEHVASNDVIKDLFQKVPSEKMIDLYKNMLSKTPEDMRENIAERLPKLSKEAIPFGDLTIYTS